MFEAKGVEGFCTRGEEGEGQFFFYGGEARKMVVGKQEEDGVGCNELHTMSCTYIHTTHTTPCTAVPRMMARIWALTAVSRLSAAYLLHSI